MCMAKRLQAMQRNRQQGGREDDVLYRTNQHSDFLMKTTANNCNHRAQISSRTGIRTIVLKVVVVLQVAMKMQI